MVWPAIEVNAGPEPTWFKLFMEADDTTTMVYRVQVIQKNILKRVISELFHQLNVAPSSTSAVIIKLITIMSLVASLAMMFSMHSNLSIVHSPIQEDS